MKAVAVSCSTWKVFAQFRASSRGAVHIGPENAFFFQNTVNIFFQKMNFNKTCSIAFFSEIFQVSNMERQSFFEKIRYSSRLYRIG